jgi:hypothetical protein
MKQEVLQLIFNNKEFIKLVAKFVNTLLYNINSEDDVFFYNSLIERKISQENIECNINLQTDIIDKYIDQSLSDNIECVKMNIYFDFKIFDNISISPYFFLETLEVDQPECIPLYEIISNIFVYNENKIKLLSEEFFKNNKKIDNYLFESIYNSRYLYDFLRKKSLFKKYSKENMELNLMNRNNNFKFDEKDFGFILNDKFLKFNHNILLYVINNYLKKSKISNKIKIKTIIDKLLEMLVFNQTNGNNSNDFYFLYDIVFNNFDSFIKENPTLYNDIYNEIFKVYEKIYPNSISNSTEVKERIDLFIKVNFINNCLYNLRFLYNIKNYTLFDNIKSFFNSDPTNDKEKYYDIIHMIMYKNDYCNERIIINKYYKLINSLTSMINEIKEKKYLNKKQIIDNTIIFLQTLNHLIGVLMVEQFYINSNNFIVFLYTYNNIFNKGLSAIKEDILEVLNIKKAQKKTTSSEKKIINSLYNLIKNN